MCDTFSEEFLFIDLFFVLLFFLLFVVLCFGLFFAVGCGTSWRRNAMCAVSKTAPCILSVLLIARRACVASVFEWSITFGIAIGGGVLGEEARHPRV